MDDQPLSNNTEKEPSSDLNITNSFPPHNSDADIEQKQEKIEQQEPSTSYDMTNDKGSLNDNSSQPPSENSEADGVGERNHMDDAAAREDEENAFHDEDDLDPLHAAELSYRRCESCLENRPRSRYSKKQWKKPYGGWVCIPCNLATITRLRRDEVNMTKQHKQDCHDQKIIDQTDKSNGTFDAKRRCLICKMHKTRRDFSGKQWKQLFRECVECVTTRRESGGKKRKAVGGFQQEKKAKITEQLCTVCRHRKSQKEFTHKQWKKSGADALHNRICKECYLKEEAAKNDHRQAIQEEEERRRTSPDDPKTKRCYACHIFKCPNMDYSKNQRQKNYGICSLCVTSLRDERKRETDHSARLCCDCREEKPISEFAREQWKKRTDVDRRCRTCAIRRVERMDEHREAEKQMRMCDDEEGDGQNTAPSSRRCFQCESFKGVGDFSVRQWTKTYPTCLGCSSPTAPDRSVSTKNVTKCEDGKEEKHDDFTSDHDNVSKDTS